jgi:hypothetical protein
MLLNTYFLGTKCPIKVIILSIGTVTHEDCDSFNVESALVSENTMRHF